MAEAEFSNVSSTSKCEFCAKPSSYKCPKCRIPFCSTRCYQNPNHNQCSESFYKDMVQTELQGTMASADSKRKMEEILKRMKIRELADDEPLDSDDDEDEVELAIRMKDVDLDDSDGVWQNLTEEERSEFRRLVASSELEELVPPFVPWWCRCRPLVEEVEGEEKGEIKEGEDMEWKDVEEGEEDDEEEYPPLVEVTQLSELLTCAPSPCLPYSILNVLSAYAWTVRLFNGDHLQSCLDATEAMLSLSPVLSSKATYEDASTAVEAVRVEAQNHLWLAEGEEFATTVRGDVRRIVEYNSASDPILFYTRVALSDVYALLTSAKTCLTQRDKTKDRQGKPVKKGVFVSTFAEANRQIQLNITNSASLKLAQKKIEFFLAYTKDRNIWTETNNSELVALM